RAERNHQVVLAFDTGHLMGEPLGGVPKLDRAINAGLLLAYYSLRAGDRVGVFGFDAQVRHYRAPQAGVRAMAGIQHACAALNYSADETNYTLGLSELGRRLRRRALVVVLTDVVDAITAELMVEHLDRLARRHVVLFVSLRDPALDAVIQAEPRDALDVHRAVVAADLVRERDAVLHRLRRRGVTCLDAAPEQVSVGLINRYLEIKRRERI
ncbi:MAG: hypothetical protein KC613_28005, partial [Myxococcales bacterium]|nr:hypothetical protein [Myxococcales bacterium]